MTHTACPICNGLQSLTIPCPTCKEILKDNGRVLDNFDDYSPYRSIDNLKETDGLSDLAKNQCPHEVYCLRCKYKNILFISEQYVRDIP